MNKDLDLAVVQMTSTEDVEANSDFILECLQRTLREKGAPDLTTCPENCLYLRLSPKSPWPDWTLDHQVFLPFREWCAKNASSLHLGSVPLTLEGRRMNATIWIDTQGKISSPYQKIHLFDVDVPGAPSVRESEQFGAGSSPAMINFLGWRVGLTICYDLRFSELFSIYAKDAVDLLLIPSAFLVPTGKAHWEVLTRARAIESQAFVAAAAQAGTHGGKRETYGHSIVIDPWGEVLWMQPSGAGVQRVRMSASQLTKVRAQIPMAGHRRLTF
ncbi:MAG: carbon-nitrogen hydrolase family protein [Bdellovibrionales bacterium]|nr:carbon-nitrogen hydrolase family protein [Bdellovibrionales bacterium]